MEDVIRGLKGEKAASKERHNETLNHAIKGLLIFLNFSRCKSKIKATEKWESEITTTTQNIYLIQ